MAGCSSTSPGTRRHLAGTSATLDAVVADYRVERLVALASHAYEVAANWKIVIENYLECYHCSSIHPELCRVTPPESDVQFPGASGAWIGGGMLLRGHAATMSLTGASFGVPIPSVPEARRREIGYVALLPNLLISFAFRLRDDPSRPVALSAPETASTGRAGPRPPDDGFD
jgi:Ring hydroxylating alpha subunit (catalytic domain)